MADNVVGSRPSASGQNLYNSTKITNSDGLSYTMNYHTGSYTSQTNNYTLYTKTKDDDYPGMWNCHLRFTRPNFSIFDSIYERRASVYTSGGSLVARMFRSGYLAPTFSVAGGISEISTNNNNTETNMYVFLPAGEYRVEFYSRWNTALFAGGYNEPVSYSASYRQGQTDIPEDALVKRWNSDFSDYMAPQPSEDGFPISWSQDGRMGWEA